MVESAQAFSPKTSSGKERSLTPTVDVAQAIAPPQNTTLKDEDWEDKKEIINALYHNMSLNQLIVEMRERHDFDAKRKSYVRRFRKWGIQKNFKAAQKEAVAEHIERRGSDPIPSELASVPLNRVQRHVRSKAKRASGTSHKDNADNHTAGYPGPLRLAVTSTTTGSQSDLNVNALMQAALLLIPSRHKSEVFLSRLQEYTHARLQIFEGQGSASPHELNFETHHVSAKYLFSIYTTIVVAQNLPWPNRRTDYYLALNNFCSLVKSTLQESHWRMMPVLLLALQMIWQRDQNTGRTIVRFVRDMAQTVFPHNPNHPLMQMLDLFWDINQDTAAIPASGEALRSEGSQVAPEDTNITVPMNADLFNLNRTFGLHSPARQAAENNYRLCLNKYGPNDPAAQMTRVVLHHLLSNEDPVAGELYQIKLCLDLFGRSFDLSTDSFQQLFELLDHGKEQCCLSPESSHSEALHGDASLSL